MGNPAVDSSDLARSEGLDGLPLDAAERARIEARFRQLTEGLEALPLYSVDSGVAPWFARSPEPRRHADL